MTAAVMLSAPAKLTLSLRVTDRRPDGYHLLEAEMVTVDLADSLFFAPGDDLSVVDEIVGGTGTAEISAGPDNLVARALVFVGRQASVRVVKRIPAGAGLGGGSADAAAVLRWARWPDPGLAVGLGSDVPFCVVGGRARVTGIGETIEPLPFEERRFVLLLPPMSVSTAAVYRAWDAMFHAGSLPPEGTSGNDLEAPALSVEPRLALWRQAFVAATGVEPRLAGSGSTWFVDGGPDSFGLEDRRSLQLGQASARLLRARTVPAT